MARKRRRSAGITLLVTGDKNPKVTLKSGMKLDVRLVTVRDGNLGKGGKKMGARLCGGTTTCLALIDLEGEPTDPGP